MATVAKKLTKTSAKKLSAVKSKAKKPAARNSKQAIESQASIREYPTKAHMHNDMQAGLLSALAVYEQKLMLKKKRELTVEEVANEIGVSRSALSNVLNGITYLPSSSRDVIEKFAQALELPVLQIFVLCGFFKPTDYVYESNLEKDLDTIYSAALTKSQDFVFQVPQPSTWKKWPLSAKYHFILMFEVASQKNLLRKAMAIAPKDIHFVVPTKK